MQQICTAVVQNMAETFIIIDALDECTDTMEIKKVVEWLKNLVSGEGRSLHVLITSRDEGHRGKRLSSAGVILQKSCYKSEPNYRNDRVCRECNLQVGRASPP